MKAKHLILTLFLALLAGAAVAAIMHRPIEPSNTIPAAENTTGTIPRVVVTASRAQAKAPAESNAAPVPRVVVTASRPAAG